MKTVNAQEKSKRRWSMFIYMLLYRVSPVTSLVIFYNLIAAVLSLFMPRIIYDIINSSVRDLVQSLTFLQSSFLYYKSRIVFLNCSVIFLKHIFDNAPDLTEFIVPGFPLKRSEPWCCICCKLLNTLSSAR